jgi:hypothetical protein
VLITESSSLLIPCSINGTEFGLELLNQQMKNTFTLVIVMVLSGFAAKAQLENGIAVTGSAGVNFSMKPVLGLGLAANLNRFYSGANITITGERSIPPILEARAGIIIGTGLSAVPYLGIAHEPKSKILEQGKEPTMVPAQTNLAYGFFMIAPTPWYKTTVIAGAHFIGEERPRRGSVMVGLKMRLNNSSPYKD